QQSASHGEIVAISAPHAQHSSSPAVHSEEWYLPSSETLQASFSNLNDSQETSSTSQHDRDFSNYRSQVDIPGNPTPIEDIDSFDQHEDFQGSRIGRFALVGLFLLFSASIALYLLKPSWSEPVWITIGLQEARSDSLERLQTAYRAQTQLLPNTRKKAQQIIQRVEQVERFQFPALVAAKLDQHLFHMEELTLSPKQLLPPQKPSDDSDASKSNDSDASKSNDSDTPKPNDSDTSKSNDSDTSGSNTKSTPKTPTTETIASQRNRLALRIQKVLNQAEKLYGGDPRIKLRKLHFVALSQDHKLAERLLQQLARQLLSTEQKARLQHIRLSLSLRHRKLLQFQSILNALEEHPLFANWLSLQKSVALALSGQHQTALQSLGNVNEHVLPEHLAMRWKKALQARMEQPKPRPKEKESSPPTPPTKTLSLKQLFRSAEYFRRRERFRKAIPVYRAVLKRAPRHLRAQNGMAWSLLEIRKYALAKRYFNKLLKKNARHRQALYGLGLTYRNQGKHTRARRVFQKYLRYYPKSSDAVEIRMMLKKL
ncbi:MAG: tetratricopeptide repeat protein, partial [Myxococcota bacterium]